MINIAGKNIEMAVADSDKARAVSDILFKKYGLKNIFDNSVITRKCEGEILLVLGGDGFMLRNLHRHFREPISFYGIHCGTTGFLMNDFDPNVDCLEEKISMASKTSISPLFAKVNLSSGFSFSVSAFNEISIFRSSSQVISITIEINGKKRLTSLIGDGIIIATPAGSSAYNFSAGGMIVPLNSNILSLTPINPFRPRRWRGALIPDDSRIDLTLQNSKARSARICADHNIYDNFETVTIMSSQYNCSILFDADHILEERLMREQFHWG